MIPMAPNVLVLGVYPCQEPRHGGQVRLAEIVAAYRRGGAQVRVMSVFDEHAYAGQRYGPFDHIYPATATERLWHGQAIPLIDDLTVGHYAAGNATAYGKLSTALFEHTDILHFEQPWLLPLVQRWQQEGRLSDTLLVHGSQNVEAPLKTAILRQYGIVQADAIAAEIDRLEQDACALADVTLAVSAADQSILQTHARQPVILAPNGIAPWQANPNTLRSWQSRLPAAPFALFVGSAHPPNISGFFDTLGDALACVPPDTKIVVAGSVGDHLPGHPRFQRWLPLNQSRLQILGILDDADLAAVKTLAHLFILPITEGGGSNIKTAEALYSGAHVVGTTVSFRGFQQFARLPGVHVCATPGAFRAAVAACLQAPPLAPASAELALRRTLTWENALAPVCAPIQRRASHPPRTT